MSNQMNKINRRIQEFKETFRFVSFPKIHTKDTTERNQAKRMAVEAGIQDGYLHRQSGAVIRGEN